VQPSDCLCVGDGGGHELSGAAAVGMRPVLLPDRDPRAHQFDLEVDWSGEYIEGLAEVLRLLD
jgi:putative hydrolase of the HAD superfamily